MPGDALVVLPICVTGVGKKLPALRDETIMLSNDSAYWLLGGVNGLCLRQKKFVFGFDNNALTMYM